jgi:hypothetical protein
MLLGFWGEVGFVLATRGFMDFDVGDEAWFVSVMEPVGDGHAVLAGAFAEGIEGCAVEFAEALEVFED